LLEARIKKLNVINTLLALYGRGHLEGFAGREAQYAVAS
jgi:hypothetical protein